MDLKFALRSLRRSPGFALLAIAILGLGIGATAAIFSVVHAVILRPLAYKNPDRIVAISSVYRHQAGYGQLSGADFLDYQKQSSAFESMSAYSGEAASVVVDANAEFAGVCGVSPGFFETFGIEPIQGHLFSANDWKQPIGNVALVSESFWSRHFGNTPFRAGRTLRTWSTTLEITGILPAGFHFPDALTTEVWIPAPVDEQHRGAYNYVAVGRLKPGISIEEAQAQLAAIASRLAKAYPGSNKDMSARVTRLGDYNVRNVKTSLYLLMGAVLLVLLIACANMANLLLARGTERIRELAIRVSLGAGQARIVRQLLVESLLLAGAGCVAGLLLARAALPALLALSPKYVPRLDQVQIDVPVLAFSMCAVIISTLLFGLAPALTASRIDPNEGLRLGGSRGMLGGSSGVLRQIFVTAEVALSVILVVSAGLLLKSFAAMTSVDLGFRPERVLLAQLDVPEASSANREHIYNTFFKPLLTRLNASSEVRSAGVVSVPPGNLGMRSNGSYIITGQTMKDFTISGPQAGLNIVSAGYFETLSIPQIAGRSFSERDDAAAPPVAIISQTLARRAFPRQDPVGQTIMCGWDENSMKWMTIVGVVGDVRIDTPNQPPDAEIYMPYLQHRMGWTNIVVKDGPNPLEAAAMFRRTVRELNPDVSVKFSTMETRLSAAVAAPRFSSVLVSVFALFALVLSIIGIYAVMAYSVSQRTSEIGLRLALGAERRQVLELVLKQGLKLTLLGLLVGTAGAMAATRLLKSQLFAISPADPSTYALALLLLIAVGALASLIPAWRAARTEPLEALREE